MASRLRFARDSDWVPVCSDASRAEGIVRHIDGAREIFRLGFGENHADSDLASNAFFSTRHRSGLLLVVGLVN